MSDESNRAHAAVDLTVGKEGTRSRIENRTLAAAALVALVGPARLEATLARWTDPVIALRELNAEVPPALTRTLAGRGTNLVVASDADFPIPAELPHRPSLLFIEGARPEAFQVPRVAIVGTRAASPHGLADARHLGAFLAAAGITVISGMAIGIDGAAHLGALSVSEVGGGPAGPVGVLATGLDVVYPRRHQVLFERVRGSGALVSECAFGTRPAPGRFPLSPTLWSSWKRRSKGVHASPPSAPSTTGGPYSPSLAPVATPRLRGATPSSPTGPTLSLTLPTSSWPSE
jgi:DNA processing protein